MFYLWECGKYSNECRKVRISEKVKSIDQIGNDGPFENCSHITHIFIPNTVTSIGNDAFRGCSSLTNINIPNSVNSIGDCAFSGCSSLTNINIPNSVNSIGYEAFDKCPMLTVITIPKRFKNKCRNNGKFIYY